MRKTTRPSFLNTSTKFIVKWVVVGIILSLTLSHWVMLYMWGRQSAINDIFDIARCEVLYEQYQGANKFTVPGSIKGLRLLEKLKKECPEMHYKILEEKENNKL